MKTTGIKSPAATTAYWRMQFESCQSALAEIIAENTENVEALRDVVVDYGDRCDDHAACQCSMARAARLVAHMTKDALASDPTHAQDADGGCRHRYPDGTACTLTDHTAPGVAQVHGVQDADGGRG